MMLALVLSLVAPASVDAGPAAVRLDDPPVRISLNQDSYFQRGDRARVHVKTAEDGYLVVLRSDAEGRVRVLFPLDPGDDDFVRGGRKIEVRGRGDREAFSVDEREGTGLVLAARSAAPIRFDEFVRGDHWDYRVLLAKESGGDREAQLLDIVQRMAGDAHFDYDAVTYTVSSPTAQYYGPGYHSAFFYGSPYRSRLSFGFGYPYRYGFPAYNAGCFDPFFYDPFFCSAAFSDPFFYDPFFYDPFFFDPFFFHRRFFFPRVFVFSRTVIVLRGRTGVVGSIPVRGRLLIDRARPGFGRPLVFKDPRGPAMQPRVRIPQGTLLSRPAARVQESAPPVRMRERAPGHERSSVLRERGETRFERPAPAMRMPERRESARVSSRPERGSDRVSSGGGRTSVGRDRGSFLRGFSGRTFAPANRGGGGRGRGGSGGRRR